MNILENNLKFKSLTYGNNPNTIVLHHAEASKCTVQDIDRWHKGNGWSGIGYHYFIRKNGAIYKGRPDNAIGAHCLHHNTNTLGICAEGSYMKETMPEVQFKAIVELCKYLKGKYNIKDIKGHGELMATSCPGVNYPLKEIKKLVLNSSTTQSQIKNNVANIINRMGVVTAKSGLRVRKAPDTNSKILTTLSHGNKIKIYKDCGNGWYDVYYGTHGGYVSKDYIKLV
ncbi:N-acetylmuramoyl-L-alanine amidase [Haloimpatiens sp. FM7315]|uniref:N-acetylmuramoyl-L-alanine amidase n=1 Tax=Haloimpatiens sp. FM7315 TaxID=3298609 RepID=UPI0035A38AB8